MALACLCAADRHHQFATEIVPALREGQVVVCDRYVASSLVLQGLDGLSAEVVWQLNHGVYRPDLSVILTVAQPPWPSGSPAASTSTRPGNSPKTAPDSPTIRDSPCA
ncbi:MAG TPA: hypothetical protein VJT49_34380 [Amycolatopsis sp.]|nr:hypothetical protein [Amycolatopsis sp.]